ncbi:MAG TPA: hypothetical protein VL689_19520 [Paraburkholderia sp.]|nr:hypothetical protein [Paraburkholderia sp.]
MKTTGGTAVAVERAGAGNRRRRFDRFDRFDRLDRLDRLDRFDPPNPPHARRPDYRPQQDTPLPRQPYRAARDPAYSGLQA